MQRFLSKVSSQPVHLHQHKRAFFFFQERTAVKQQRKKKYNAEVVWFLMLLRSLQARLLSHPVHNYPLLKFMQVLITVIMVWAVLY